MFQNGLDCFDNPTTTYCVSVVVFVEVFVVVLVLVFAAVFVVVFVMALEFFAESAAC